MVAEGWADGSTGAVCFTDPRSKKIHTANVGDSEVFVIRKGDEGVQPILLSFKHKPSDAAEKARIEEAGGHVVFGRILGNLAVARAFGDKDFKHPHNKAKASFVSVEPYTSVHDITDADEVLVICCDGMFEKLSYQQVADCIWERKQAGDNPADAADVAVKKAFESGSLDNISCVLVYLR
jgi:integrin-linked kinase-associated serine/threonine phosphatase 2C